MRFAIHSDIEPIKSLVKNFKSKDNFERDLNMFLKSRKLEVSKKKTNAKQIVYIRLYILFWKHGVDLQVFVAEVFEQVVGVAIIKEEKVICLSV